MGVPSYRLQKESKARSNYLKGYVIQLSYNLNMMRCLGDSLKRQYGACTIGANLMRFWIYFRISLLILFIMVSSLESLYRFLSSKRYKKLHNGKLFISNHYFCCFKCVRKAKKLLNQDNLMCKRQP